jgi:hypothetical protein
MEVVNTTSTVDPVHMYNKLNNFIMKPIVFIIVLLIVVIYYLFSYSLGKNQKGGDILSSSNTSSSTSSGSSGQIMGVIIIVVLVVLILINAAQYFFSVNVTAYVKGLLEPTTQVDVVVDQTTAQPSPVPEIKFRKQVFNIPGNYYNYQNAKAVCQAYGAQLATYDQIEESYNKGAEWCNYGWSDGQMALFPTQTKTYNKLQTIQGHEQDCGRPGINGGYIANPEVRFGVNCYGNKPKMTSQEEQIMENAQPYPQNAQDLVFQKRVDFWRTKVDDILVSPFNKNTWGEPLL